MLNNETTIILDLARSDIEFLNYSVLEVIKNGKWTSGKYTGKYVNRKQPCFLIIFANNPP